MVITPRTIVPTRKLNKLFLAQPYKTRVHVKRIENFKIRSQTEFGEASQRGGQRKVVN